MKGKFIGIQESRSVYSVEKRFVAESAKNAVLRITALGLYFAEINGRRVGDAYLTPGWTSYKNMLQLQEYDVSGYLRAGENVITLTVGEGWYCGRIGWENAKNLYGENTAVCAELYYDGNVLITDESWSARESHIRESGIYDGETVDFTAVLKPLTVTEVPFDKSVLVNQICEPVRNIERIPVKEIIITPSGETVYDFGQNIAGVVEIRTPEDFCGTLTMQFAEILVDGNFYTENLRTAKATDTLTVQSAKTFSPEFTYHGFRYMKLTGAKLRQEDVCALVRHTDMKRTGNIVTSDDRVNRLFANVVWGQKGNFVDIPSDCPQRDERLGWTGDINAFCTTAAYNYDIRRFMKKWLADVRNDQTQSGAIPHVIPDILRQSNPATCAMWCDAVTMVPWKLYKHYGDISYLADNYEAMKKFIPSREKNCEEGFVVRGFEYGDWLALDNEEFAPGEHYGHVGRTDTFFIANVFYCESLRIVAECAALLGKKEDAMLFGRKRNILLNKIRKEYFTATGRLALDTVTAQVLALYFNVVPDKYRFRLARELNENMIRRNYRITTGFIGTPYLLFALADNGYMETAGKAFMNRNFPGWLYEVDMGATTIWEHWNSLKPDGKPSADGMNSYNHYAYGSVMEFVYRRIAGIECKEAGFKQVRIAPHPIGGLKYVCAEYDSMNGKIISGYEQKDDKIRYFAQVPKGIKAEIILPHEGKTANGCGTFEFERQTTG